MKDIDLPSNAITVSYSFNKYFFKNINLFKNFFLRSKTEVLSKKS